MSHNLNSGSFVVLLVNVHRSPLFFTFILRQNQFEFEMDGVLRAIDSVLKCFFRYIRLIVVGLKPNLFLFGALVIKECKNKKNLLNQFFT